MSYHGLGKHSITIAPADTLILYQANFWLSIFAMLIGLGLVKISIGLNLLRLSTNKWYKWSLWATIGMFWVQHACQVLITNRHSLCCLLHIHGLHDLFPAL